MRTRDGILEMRLARMLDTVPIRATKHEEMVGQHEAIDAARQWSRIGWIGQASSNVDPLRGAAEMLKG